MTDRAVYAALADEAGREVPSSRQPPPAEAEPPAWPELDPAALSGIAGEIVSTIAPHTEADPVAILGHLLVMVGNCVGRGPFFPVEADRHYANLFAILVGATGSARKGTAKGQAKQVFEVADPEWLRECWASGLSSGEGLIYHVRDPDRRLNKAGEPVLADAGVSDKRLLVIESEFASTCKVMGREGNTLSPVLRNAWDATQVLRSLTKNSPLQASDAHISIIGHVTAGELRRYLDRAELGNGFANRFLFLCVRRANVLPNGGRVTDADRVTMAHAMAAAVTHARRIEGMHRDAEASELWASVYPTLSAGRPGVWGSVTSRAEAQTLRLSMIYALLEGGATIRRPHLEAALAVWAYADASVRYVFGESLGDPVADEILSQLRARPEGMTRAALYDHFGRNRSREVIAYALRGLAERGLAECLREDTGGRPAERWLATRKTRETRKGAGTEGVNAYNALNAYPDEAQ